MHCHINCKFFEGFINIVLRFFFSNEETQSDASNRHKKVTTIFKIPSVYV